MPINRGPFNALVDDDGSNTTGSKWNKTAIAGVVLDPVDAEVARLDAADAAIAALFTWKPVPFNAADFTTDTGTWTVDAGDVLTNKYILVNKLMIWTLEMQATTIAGGPGILQVKLPAGKVAATGNCSFTSFISNNGVYGAGLVQLAGTNLARNFIQSLGAWTNCVNNSFIRFTLTFEVQ